MEEKAKTLISKVKAGDETSFTALCEKYEALISSSSERYYGMMIGENEMSVEDFKQEATLALFRAAKSYDLDQSAVTFGLYAKTCIRNALVSLLRKSAKKPRTVNRDEDQHSVNDPLSGLLSRETMNEVTDKLASIFSSYEYKVFIMYAEGKTPRQIARELGTSAKSASNALFRAREKLKTSFHI